MAGLYSFLDLILFFGLYWCENAHILQEKCKKKNMQLCVSTRTNFLLLNCQKEWTLGQKQAIQSSNHIWAFKGNPLFKVTLPWR